jgi:hypothetical protein
MEYLEGICICKCECHIKGNIVLHFIACCELTGESYINIDGSIDFEIYKKLINGSDDQNKTSTIMSD